MAGPGSLLVLLTVTAAALAGEGKICWKACQEEERVSPIQSVRMTGCSRRSSYPSTQNFRCPDKEGEGPPCTTRHQDIVYLDIVFNHTGLEEGQLIQSAGARAKSGILSYVEAPWATLDGQGCDYLDTSGGHVGCTGEAGTSRVKLPITIESFFPQQTYFVRYYLEHSGRALACLAFPLRICSDNKCLEQW